MSGLGSQIRTDVLSGPSRADFQAFPHPGIRAEVGFTRLHPGVGVRQKLDHPLGFEPRFEESKSSVLPVRRQVNRPHGWIRTTVITSPV